MFSLKACDLVIGINTNLKTEISQQWVAPNSIQGIFTKKFFDGNHTKLDSKIQTYIKENSIPTDKNGHIDYGVVIQVEIKPNTAYLVSMAHFNKQGKAESSCEIIVQNVLPLLWQHIASHPGKCEHIVIPLLGTNYSGISATRETLAKAIINTYMLASVKRLPCKKLTIVFHPKDVKAHNINIKKLADYLKHECEYFFEKNDPIQTKRIGTAIP